MRVLLDTTYALRGPSGTGVYIERLAAALREAGVDVVEAADTRRPPPAGGGRGQRAQPRPRRAGGRRSRCRAGRGRRGADVIHHPLPAHAAQAPCPQVVTRPRPRLRAPARVLRPRLPALGVARAPPRRARGATPSSASRRPRAATRWRAGAWTAGGSSSRRTGRARRRRRRRPAARGAGPLPLRRRRRAAQEPRAAARRARALPRRRRRGGAGPRPRRPRPAAAGSPACAPSPEPDLAALLAQAAALVHPALHEGFGLTALEAMHAGVPVIAARSPGLAETCAEAALYVDPYDADGPRPRARARRRRPGAARDARRRRPRARRRVLLARVGACPHRGLYAGRDA